MKIDIISLFPEYFKSPFEQSILKRAVQKKLITINCIDLRNFGLGIHKQVDDRTYGGGVGMVLKPEPIFNAINCVKERDSYCIYLSPQGNLLTANKSRKLASYSHLVFLCGHYEGVDERVIDECIDEEISIGDYVLTNGLAAALVVIDALVRFIPGVIENTLASEQDSFENNLLDFSHYTRPKVFRGREVPQVLLDGNHKSIDKWRMSSRLNNTFNKRSDLYFRYLLDNSENLDKDCNFPKQNARIDIKYFLMVKNIQEALRFYASVFFGFCEVISKEMLLAQMSLFEGQLKLLFKVLEEKEVFKTNLFSITLEEEDVFFTICHQWKKKSNVFLQQLNKNSWTFSSKDPSENGWIFILNGKDKNL